MINIICVTFIELIKFPQKNSSTYKIVHLNNLLDWYAVLLTCKIFNKIKISDEKKFNWVWVKT